MTSNGPEGPDLIPPAPAEPPSVSEPAPPAPAPARKPRPDAWTIVIGILGGVLLGTGVTFAILGFTGTFDEPEPTTIPPPPTITIPPPTTPPTTVAEDPSPAGVAARAVPSIVAIEVGGIAGNGGSGVIYGDDGYVITNHHVIEGSDDLAVIFSDGARYPADLVGSDPTSDVAVLRVERPDITPIEVGDPETVRVGDRSVAIGNPLALSGGPSVTSGIVSALDRWLDIDTGETLYGLIQTDAPITHGSSGGALLDGGGRLIGITTAIAASDLGAEGFGFAIPIDIAVAVANDLIASGTVEHAALGIRGGTYFAEQDGAEYPVGVLVDSTTDESPYSAAGGQANDVIVSLDGATVDSLETLLTVLRRHRAGDQVTVGATRAEDDVELAVTLTRLTP